MPAIAHQLLLTQNLLKKGRAKNLQGTQNFIMLLSGKKIT
jgi:hypothetical protein